MSVSCECCVLSGRGLCVVQRSSAECGVSEGDREASTMRRPWPSRAVAPWKENYTYLYFVSST